MLVCVYDYEIELRTPFENRNNIVDCGYYMQKDANDS